MSRRAQLVVGGAKLGLDCLGGLIGVVEQMHETIARRPRPWTSRKSEPQGAHGPVAAGIYATLRGTVGWVGRSLRVPSAHEGLLSHFVHAEGVREEGVPPPGGVGVADAADAGEHHARLVAVLNGICGDHLEASENPLAIRMELLGAGGRRGSTVERATSLRAPAASRIVVLVHGLCLSERAWSRGGGPDLGSRLRDELGYAPLYLRYNTGRHISTNGRELADQLERLVSAWPVAVESLTLVGHSMGGLVSRSAGWYGAKQGHTWPTKLRAVVCLGTPHHGAPLEKGGHLLTAVMRTSPYVDPLALGRLRSAGIKDLRHGNLLDEDWQGRDPEALHGDPRQVVPLLPHVDYYFAAATVGRHGSDARGRALGDLLVRTESALGVHPSARQRLRVPPERCRIFYERNHFDLLSDPSVHDQVVTWLRAAPRPSPARSRAR